VIIASWASELEIFIFDEEVGPGLPLWLPNGGISDRRA
jgi:threonyl-tRNA synthetase